ncbi:MAG: 3-hydroxyacyl-CoA dehydrogenase NAD-binding domain-containing protein, partial [Pseudomonadota bacterium]
SVKRGKMTAQQRDSALAERLTVATELSHVAPADLIIEAVFEDLSVKTEIFEKLDAIAPPGAILATNTSYLDVNAIAAATKRPQDVIGLHFFSPAHVMRLLEVVVADKTAPDAVATGFALAKKLGKIAVRAGVCDGFIGNRILSHYRKAAEYLVMDGASPREVDAALEDFGFAMGPYAVFDLAGLDIAWASRKRLAPTRPKEERYIPISDRLCENGWFGRKTGRGYYLHDAGSKERPANPDALAIIDEERKKAGITPRKFSPEEIVERYLTAMICEAARVVEDGTALRPIDVDAVFLFGYGFPRFRGGPLHYADTVGASALMERIERFSKEDAFYWQVPELIRKMAADGTCFSDLN